MMRDRYSDAVTAIDAALALPGAAAHPALRARALLTVKAEALWPLGRGAEEQRVAGGGRGDRTRAGRPDAARPDAPGGRRARPPAPAAPRAHAPWPTRRWSGPAPRETTSRWPWRRWQRAMAAEGADELRERVEIADSLLAAVGNRHQRAGMLASAAYMALTERSDRRRQGAPRPCDPPGARGRQPVPLDARAWQPGHGRAADGRRGGGRSGVQGRSWRSSASSSCCPSRPKALSGLAAVAAAGGDDARAARLAGAAAAHRYGEPRTVVDARLDDDLLPSRPDPTGRRDMGRRGPRGRGAHLRGRDRRRPREARAVSPARQGRDRPARTRTWPSSVRSASKKSRARTLQRRGLCPRAGHILGR